MTLRAAVRHDGPLVLLTARHAITSLPHAASFSDCQLLFLGTARMLLSATRH